MYYFTWSYNFSHKEFIKGLFLQKQTRHEKQNPKKKKKKFAIASASSKTAQNNCTFVVLSCIGSYISQRQYQIVRHVSAFGATQCSLITRAQGTWGGVELKAELLLRWEVVRLEAQIFDCYLGSWQMTQFFLQFFLLVFVFVELNSKLIF